MKILTDENIDPVVVEAIRTDGHNVLDIKTERLQGSPDSPILDLAVSEKRVIVTHDKDYLELSRRHPKPTSSVIILPANQTARQMITRLRKILADKHLFRRKKPFVLILVYDRREIYRL